jgi:hypothetical protein
MIYADFRKKMQNTIIPNVTLAENINYDYYLVNFINAMNNCGVK